MRRKALKAAFPYTLPIFAGFWFLGLAYGIYMNVSGFSFVYPMIMSFTIYGGSLEFVAVSMLLSPFAPLQTFIMTLMIQARHLFYGLAMLDRFKGLGWKRFYLIFGMCDETFSINYTADIPEDVDRGWFMLFVTFLNQMYWFTGATIGGLAGSLLKFNTEGLSFVMTAMFVVIFLEQWKKEKRRWTAAVGIGASAACLAIFGPDSFMIPTMIAIITLLCLLRRPMGYEKLADETEEESEKLDDETKENSETLTDGTKENSEKLIGESKGKAADPAGPEANSPAAPSDAPDTDHPEGGNL
ncbi:MAG: AzlC family ABC transporter permease [Anaerovoracaceae bacterium]|jgi:4-azaleucine resistance transporter AzlC